MSIFGCQRYRVGDDIRCDHCLVQWIGREDAPPNDEPTSMLLYRPMRVVQVPRIDWRPPECWHVRSFWHFVKRRVLGDLQRRSASR